MLLSETNRNHIATFAGRVAAHRLLLDVALDHHRLNTAEYEAAQIAAGGGGGGPEPSPPGRYVFRDGDTVPVVGSIRLGGVLVPLT